jgi:CubicO group peptidase (beta-lactamase class C family)
VHEVLHGRCDPRFEKVADALAEKITRGEEVGAAIDIDIELVVGMWGGHADTAKAVQWAQDTIVDVFSSTKYVTALAGLMPIDRGLVDASAPVADYWPEFAANSKQHIEFRHRLSHRSGLSGWDLPFTNEDMYEWDESTAAVAAQAPWRDQGTHRATTR